MQVDLSYNLDDIAPVENRTQLSISLCRKFTSCLFVGRWFFGGVIEVSEKQSSHRDKAFVSLLEDTLATQVAAQNGS